MKLFKRGKGKTLIAFLLVLTIVIGAVPANITAYAENEGNSQTVDVQASSSEQNAAALDESQKEQPATEEKVTEKQEPDAESLKEKNKEKEQAAGSTEEKAAGEDAKTEKTPVKEEQDGKTVGTEKTEAAFSYEKSFKRGTIRITAEAGVLPEGTKASVKPLSSEEAKNLLQKSAAEDNRKIVDAVLFDVVLHDSEGKEIQPEGNVSITISGLNMEAPQSGKAQSEAVRVQNAGKKVDVLKRNVDTDSSKVTFRNDHFTPVGVATYAVVSGKFKGYNDFVKGTSYVKPLYVEDGGKQYIAYCFNASKGYPSDYYYNGNNDYTTYNVKYADATDADFKSCSVPSTRTLPNKKDNVLKTVYYGYPYNAGGIQERYGLTDMQFRCVTQAAIWRWTDNEPLYINNTQYGAVYNLTYLTEYAYNSNGTIKVDSNGNPIITSTKMFNWTTNMTSAYNALVNNGSFEYPLNFELDLYQCANSGVQNLLSTKMKDADVPSVATITGLKKIDGENPNNRTFTFGIWKKGYENDPSKMLGKVQNDANGNFTFKLIGARTGDVYAIKEINDNQDGIIYDTKVRYVTVTGSKTVVQTILNAQTVTGYSKSNGDPGIKADGKDVKVYGINSTVSAHSGNFSTVVNPTSLQLKNYIQSRSSVYTSTYLNGYKQYNMADATRKVLYYFSTHGITEAIQTEKYSSGAFGSMVLTENNRKALMLVLTGAGGYDANYKYGIDYILKNSNPPADYTVAMFVSAAGSQPVIGGFTKNELITQSAGATELSLGVDSIPVINNETEKQQEAQIEALKTLDGNAPGADKTFHFELYDSTKTRLLGEADNEADGSVIFPYTITEEGTYWVREVPDTATYPDVQFDEEWKKVEVTFKESQTVNNGDIHVVDTDTINSYIYIRMSDGSHHRAYCINETRGYPDGENYELIVSPNQGDLEQDGNGISVIENNIYGSDLEDNLKKIVYFLDNNDTLTVNGTAINLTDQKKQYLMWSATGSSAYPMSTKLAEKGRITSVTHKEAIDEILRISNPPADFELVLGMDSEQGARKQPIISGYGDTSKVTYEGSVSKPVFKNTTKEEEKPGVQIVARKTLDNQAPGTGNTFKFELYDSTKKNKISEAENTADGNVAFPDEITESGTYYIREVKNNEKYPDIVFDESWKKVEVNISTENNITDGQEYYAGTYNPNRNGEFYFYLNSNPLKKGYGVNASREKPLMISYKVTMDPTAAQLEYVKVKSYLWGTEYNDPVVEKNIYGTELESKLKQLVYYLDNNDSLTVGGKRITLTGQAKQDLMWAACGSYNLNNKLQENGTDTTVSYSTALNEIFRISNPPASFRLLLALDVDNLKQPIIAGYGVSTQVTYEGGEALFKNETRKEPEGEFILEKVDGMTGKAPKSNLSQFKFTLTDSKGTVVAGHENESVGSDGRIVYTGLPLGEYTLKEVSSPDAYAKLDKNIKIKVQEGSITVLEPAPDNSDFISLRTVKNSSQGDSAAASIPEGVESINVLTVKNYQRIDIPESGSRGRLYVWIAGIALVALGAVMMAMTRRKKKGNQDKD